jgi:hypothetical protein
MFNLKSWINKEPENIESENIDFIFTLVHFGYKGKVFEVVYREYKRHELFPLITVEAFDKYSKNFITRRYISTTYSRDVLKFEIECLKEALKNTMITSEDIYK